MPTSIHPSRPNSLIKSLHTYTPLRLATALSLLTPSRHIPEPCRVIRISRRVRLGQRVRLATLVLVPLTVLAPDQKLVYARETSTSNTEAQFDRTAHGVLWRIRCREEVARADRDGLRDGHGERDCYSSAGLVSCVVGGPGIDEGCSN